MALAVRADFHCSTGRRVNVRELVAGLLQADRNGLGSLAPLAHEGLVAFLDAR
jgi:hypothetical protein